MTLSPTYTPAQTFRLLTTYLGPKPIAFHPSHLPKPFTPILLALLKTYMQDPHNIPARQAALITELDKLTPKQTRTFEAYLEEGGIEYHAAHTGIGPAQKNILRALFNIAPAPVAHIAEYTGADLGNTHRRLQSLIKKELIRRTNHHGKTLYHLSPKHFIVENPFPDPFENLDFHHLLADLTAETEALETLLAQ